MDRGEGIKKMHPKKSEELWQVKARKRLPSDGEVPTLEVKIHQFHDENEAYRCAKEFYSEGYSVLVFRYTGERVEDWVHPKGQDDE
jgi:hypothetical protein